MGAPGSGKGTISKRIVKDFKLYFVSSGDLLRQEISSRSGKKFYEIPIYFQVLIVLSLLEVGIACENFIKRGELVSDDILDSLLFKVLAAHTVEGWLLDGTL